MQEVVSLGIGELCAGMQFTAEDYKRQKILKTPLYVEPASTPIDILGAAGLGYGRMPDLCVAPVIWKDRKIIIPGVVNNIPAEES